MENKKEMDRLAEESSRLGALQIKRDLQSIQAESTDALLATNKDLADACFYILQILDHRQEVVHRRDLITDSEIEHVRAALKRAGR